MNNLPHINLTSNALWDPSDYDCVGDLDAPPTTIHPTPLPDTVLPDEELDQDDSTPMTTIDALEATYPLKVKQVSGVQ